jgi:cytochrome P450/NADPH-cytochrome P450 reductase
MTYQTGDHLGVLPRNDAEVVTQALARFGVARDVRVRIQLAPGSSTHLPVDTPISAFELLSDYLELQEPATRTQLKVLAGFTECPPEKQQILALAGDDEASVTRYRDEVLAPRMSVLTLLEEFKSCALPFHVYLELAPALRPRYYSISSSPLADAHRCSITVGVLEGPARWGTGRYRGVCSHFLAHAAVEDTVYAFVHPPSSPFRPPQDLSIPIIMIGAGTGLAPFRGFLQDRAAQKVAGTTISPSLLFFGCRNPEQDFLYADELQGFVAAGVTHLECAFSRVEGQPKTYVQDVIRAHWDEVWEMLESGAIVYVCGDASHMAAAVRETFKALYREQLNVTAEQSESWLMELTASQGYRVDVWPSS